MNIVVCVKQIPDTNDVKWSKDNNIIRDNIISVLNPYDLKGILTALDIKNRVKNTKITLLSMGPLNFEESLFLGLSLGADEAVLLSDKRFSGADTSATSKTLAYAVKNVIKNFDLIITGQFALDGDTAQTPYSLAARLEIEALGYVNNIINVNENEITVEQIKDNKTYETKSSCPVLISISDYKNKIKKPGVYDYMEGKDKPVKILNADDILINCNDIGIKGSPTCVIKAFKPENKRECRFTDDIKEIRSIIQNG